MSNPEEARFLMQFLAHFVQTLEDLPLIIADEVSLRQMLLQPLVLFLLTGTR